MLVYSEGVVGEDEIISGEFLVLLRGHTKDPSLTHLLSLTEVLTERRLAARTYLHLRRTDVGVAEALEQHPTVELVEANRRLNLVSPVDIGLADTDIGIGRMY